MTTVVSVDKTKTIEIKASLLARGIDFELDLFQDIERPFYDNQFVYGKTSERVSSTNKFPQVLELGDDVVVALLRRENSPWSLRIEEGEVQLYESGERVRQVDLPERPPFFDKTLSDGTPTESIIAVAGADTPGFFLFPECYYFPEGLPCGFCSLRSTRKTVGKYMVSEFSEENIREATELFQTTPWRDIPLVSLTMGTPRTDDEAREHVIKPIGWMNDTLDSKIPIHLLAHPPNDYGLLKEYRDAGVTSIAFNMEVYDRQRFGEICPGKAEHYGYDRWEESLMRAKEIFGDYRVYCGLVWGLESPESTIAGHEHFLERGIGIASNIFHADPSSVLRQHPQPTEEQILHIARAESEIYTANPHVGTIFSVSMRSTIDWEVHRGDLR